MVAIEAYYENGRCVFSNYDDDEIEIIEGFSHTFFLDFDTQDQRNEIKTWCEQNAIGRWSLTVFFLDFELVDDALRFRLTFG